jgi:hypothetical protein
MSTQKQGVFTETGDYSVYVPVANPNEYNQYPAWQVYEEQSGAYMISDYLDLQVAEQFENSFVTTDRGIYTRLPPGFGPFANTGYIGQRLRTPVLTLQIGDYTTDLRQANATYGMSVDRCRVTISGKYSIGILSSNQNQVSTAFNFDPSETTIRYSYNLGDGSTITPAPFSIQNYKPPSFTSPAASAYSSGATISAPTPFLCSNNFYQTGVTQPNTQNAPLITAVQQGSAVTGGAVNQATNLRMTVEIENTSQKYSGDAIKMIVPYIIADEDSSGRSFFTGTFTREWEGNLYIIDGQENDTVPIQSTFTFEATAFTRVEMEPLTLQSNTAVSEQSQNVVRRSASVSAAFTLEATAKVFKTVDIELINRAYLLSSTENLVRMDPLIMSVTSAVAVSPTFKMQGNSIIAVANTADFLGNMLYDVTGNYNWNSFNQNEYFVSGYIDGDYALEQGEYSWNFLTTDTWDDWTTSTWIGNESSWDNWPDNVWEREYSLPIDFIATITPSFKLGNILTYNGNFTLQENSAFNKEVDLELFTTFNTSFTASGRIDGEADISSAFAPNLILNIKYALDDAPILLSGAFNTVLIANARTDITDEIVSTFSLSVAPTFKPSAYQTQMLVTTDVDIAPTFKPSAYQVELSAFTITLSVIRLFYAADPYNIWTIDPETRVILVPVENLQTKIDQEIRVNIVSAESRGYLVPQETRNLTIMKAPFKNRFSVPKVRAEQ